MKFFFTNCLRKIDIFGIKTELQINSQSKFKSISGGFFTLIYVASAIVLFVLLGEDIFFHQNPTTGFSQIYNPNPEKMIISPTSYFFMLGLQDSSANHFIDPTIYNITAHNTVRNQTTGQETSILIPLVPCKEELLPPQIHLKNYFKALVGGPDKLSSIYCIAQGFENSFKIMGAWDQPKFDYIKVNIYPCSNSSSSVICKDNNTIKKQLSRVFYGFYSTDYLFDLLNFEQPGKIYGRNYYIPTAYNIKKTVDRYLSTCKVISDEGWLFSDVIESGFYSWSYDKESFDLLREEDFGSSMLMMLIRKSYYENIYTRNYKKIKTLVGEMSGFLNFIILALILVSKPFTKREYYTTLANNAFDFEDTEDKQENKEKFKQQVRNLKSMMDEETLTPKNRNRASEYFHSIMKLKDSPLKMSFWEWIKSYFTKAYALAIKKKQKIKGLDLIFSHLDIDYILKKFMELDKLKLILLDEDQHKLFEYLPKPIITKDLKIKMGFGPKDNTNEKKAKNFLLENDTIIKIRNVQVAFEKIANKTEMTPIDMKLINMLDENILELLKKDKKNISENTMNDENKEKKEKSGFSRENIESLQKINVEMKSSIFKNIPISKI